MLVANYIREELPVRLAHRIREFQQLPFVVGANPQIEQVYQLYWEAFEKFRSVPTVKTIEENRQFCNVVKSMLQIHRKVIPLLVRRDGYLVILTDKRWLESMKAKSIWMRPI